MGDPLSRGTLVGVSAEAGAAGWSRLVRWRYSCQLIPSARYVFQALQHRNFRLLWVGLLVSFSGSYMQTAAILWHVSLLVPDERRALALGMVGLVRVVPIVVFSSSAASRRMPSIAGS